MHPMNGQTTPRSLTLGRSRAAFTLIELLVVIAVIALLASMIFPITGAVNRAKIRGRTQAQRAQLETAIDSYKAKRGVYPPDNAGYPTTNQLYFELVGTTLANGEYVTLDRSARIKVSDLAVFGSGVGGFVNCVRGGGGDEGSDAENFLKGLKPDQVAEFPNGLKVIIGVPWKRGDPPFNKSPLDIAGYETVNPWRYVSSNPTNNPSSYDLWIDVMIGDKAYRYCNWSKDPLRITTP
jgi:prepilin-type N-terminal cleavage/methylation domain-containing protein